MDARDLLIDIFGRIRERFVDVADDLDLEVGHSRPGGTGNSIVWLLWHTARVQDDHVAGLSGGRAGLARRLGRPVRLPLRPPTTSATGTPPTTSTPCASSDLEDLVDYHEAVHQQTLAYLDRVDADELDRVDRPQLGPARDGRVCGWSACSATACSTSARRPT